MRASGYVEGRWIPPAFSSRGRNVMDLETGEILWVGEGRNKEDFRRFFDEIIAVAMSMNASYHIVVQEMLPQTQIVYDRYHVQAQCVGNGPIG